MSGDNTMLALHDRATRGNVLSSENQTRLEQWYMLDKAQLEMLHSITAEATTADLQSQITVILERCITLSQRIQELTQSNEDARHELVQLRQQVAQHLQAA
jgi:hypothetical protein